MDKSDDFSTINKDNPVIKMKKKSFILMILLVGILSFSLIEAGSASSYFLSLYTAIAKNQGLNGTITISTPSSGKAASSAHCKKGQNLCGNSCVNLKTDNDNCGFCGNTCSKDQACIKRKCEQTTTTNTTTTSTSPKSSAIARRSPTTSALISGSSTSNLTSSQICSITSSCGAQQQMQFYYQQAQEICRANPTTCDIANVLNDYRGVVTDCVLKPDAVGCVQAFNDFKDDFNKAGGCPPNETITRSGCKCISGTLCPAPLGLGEFCADVFKDNNNCGACGRVCPQGTSCGSEWIGHLGFAKCVPNQCDAGYKLVNGECIACPAGADENCQCPTGEHLAIGFNRCDPDCTSGQVNDPQTGACSSSCTSDAQCSLSKSCQAGQCVCKSPLVGDSTGACCDLSYGSTSFQDDIYNCGKCNNNCIATWEGMTPATLAYPHACEGGMCKACPLPSIWLNGACECEDINAHTYYPCAAPVSFP